MRNDPPLYVKSGHAFCRGLECSQIRLLITDLRGEYGAFMEPSGRNQWQPVANRRPRKRRNQAKTVATGCDQLPWDLDGKEGVDGSSPSEGFTKRPANGLFSCSDSLRPSLRPSRICPQDLSPTTHGLLVRGLTDASEAMEYLLGREVLDEAGRSLHADIAIVNTTSKLRSCVTQWDVRRASAFETADRDHSKRLEAHRVS
jgi:hypothetical protein